MKNMVVNMDGWFGKVIDYKTGKKSSLCPGCNMIKVKILGYTELLESDPFNEFTKRDYPIGNIILANERQFKPYPEYVGFKCGEWVKA